MSSEIHHIFQTYFYFTIVGFICLVQPINHSRFHGEGFDKGDKDLVH